jgi:hypothetical protein
MRLRAIRPAPRPELTPLLRLDGDVSSVSLPVFSSIPVFCTFLRVLRHLYQIGKAGRKLANATIAFSPERMFYFGGGVLARPWRHNAL